MPGLRFGNGLSGSSRLPTFVNRQNQDRTYAVGTVIPAKAGIQWLKSLTIVPILSHRDIWTPAFAGVTDLGGKIASKDFENALQRSVCALSVSACPCILFASWGGASRMIGQGKSIAR